MRPPEYEFPDHVKVEALKRAGWCCERCGIPKTDTFEGFLEIHHILGIAISIRHHPELAPAVISSLANARVLCDKCHKIQDIEDRQNHILNAKKLVSQFSFSGKLPA